jgi:glutamine cyclotransferase
MKMKTLRIAVAWVLITVAACTRNQPPNPLEVARKQLSEGNSRAAVETLRAVPANAPEAAAASWMLTDMCTRIELVNHDASGARPRVDLVEIVTALPHDPSCWTEGLEFDGEAFFESCGDHGSSTVRRVDIRTGAVLLERKLRAMYFGEGLTQFGGALFVLTYREWTGLVFDPKLSRQLRTFPLVGEGWGLTHDATSLIYSNGTNQIRFLDPNSGALTRAIEVFNGDVPLLNINELEYVNGELLANVWPTERIARIDPASGTLRGWILAEGLLPNRQRLKTSALNGIAFDSAGGRLFLTGKLWPNVFVVRLRPLSL